MPNSKNKVRHIDNPLFNKDDEIVGRWLEDEGLLEALMLDAKQAEDYKRRIFGDWKIPEHPTPYKEVVNSINWENIYEHNCPCCKRDFFGYKYRTICLDCKKGGYRDE